MASRIRCAFVELVDRGMPATMFQGETATSKVRCTRQHVERGIVDSRNGRYPSTMGLTSKIVCASTGRRDKSLIALPPSAECTNTVCLADAPSFLTTRELRQGRRSYLDNGFICHGKGWVRSMGNLWRMSWFGRLRRVDLYRAIPRESADLGVLGAGSCWFYCMAFLRANNAETQIPTFPIPSTLGFVWHHTSTARASRNRSTVPLLFHLFFAHRIEGFLLSGKWLGGVAH